MIWVLKGYAKENLLRAYKFHAIPELLKSLNLPYKEYCYGDSAIAFEFGIEKEGWRGNIKRQKLSGAVQAIVDLRLALFEKETGGEYNCGYNNKELALRYALQQLELPPEKITQLKSEIREKLAKVMIITDEADKWEPLPRPEIVPFDEVFDNFYPPEYVAEKLKVSRERVIAWCREGKIRAVKAGKKWRIPEDELNKLELGLKNYEEWHKEPLE